ncbi:MAG: ferrous iron transport protein B [Thermodesulfobacteriota bacterium]
MSISLALAGNPNSGKTTLFNALTGARQHVGNYPGVTVEKREGKWIDKEKIINVTDLPGTYSLTAYSPEEKAARDFLLDNRDFAVLDILDSTNLERHLYLAIQFLELGVPLFLAVNMMDEAEKEGIEIDTNLLSSLLGVPVIPTVAREGKGKAEISEALSRIDSGEFSTQGFEISYGDLIDSAIKEIEQIIKDFPLVTQKYPPKWTALKYIEQDPEIVKLISKADVQGKIDKIFNELRKKSLDLYDLEPETIISDKRYGYISGIAKQTTRYTRESENRHQISDRIDSVLTHSITGPVIMIGVFYLLFKATFFLGEAPMGVLESLIGLLGDGAAAVIPEGHLQSLLVSGVIDGVGGVLGFLPLIAVMFFMITFLEDAGYMARMAYMLDRIFKTFGLHGSSVMPFIISGGIPGGCAVPGVMAARTLKSKKERIATILTAPLLVCGAKVPVFVLLCGAFFGEKAAMAMFWITIGAWAAALLTAKLLRSTVIKGESTPFIMELPPYRLPTLKGVLLHTWERAKQYIKKAGTFILAISIVIWAAMTFPGLPETKTAEFESMKNEISAQYSNDSEKLHTKLLEVENLENQESLKNSTAGRIGTFLTPVTQYAGFDWKTNIALVGGFGAKEVIVSTLGTAYSLGEVDPEAPSGLSDRLVKDPYFDYITAISLMIFVLLYAPCFVTVVATAKEIGWRWAALGVIGNTAIAFILSVVFYQTAKSGIF